MLKQITYSVYQLDYADSGPEFNYSKLTLCGNVLWFKSIIYTKKFQSFFSSNTFRLQKDQSQKQIGGLVIVY